MFIGSFMESLCSYKDLWVYETGKQNLDGSVGIFHFISCLEGLFGALKDAMRLSRVLHNI